MEHINDYILACEVMATFQGVILLSPFPPLSTAGMEPSRVVKVLTRRQSECRLRDAVTSS